MQLNDLIEEQSIESIAKKTNVTEAVITKLLNQEFKTLNLPQALGALSIIEREYGVDLNALRQECKAYFADYDSLEGALPGLTPVKNKGRVIPRLLIFAFLALLAYGAWYFFTGYYNQKILPWNPKSEKSLIDTILHSNDTAAKETKQDIETENLSQDDAAETATGDDIEINTAGADKPAIEQGSESNQSVQDVVPQTVVVKEDTEANQSTLTVVSVSVIGEQNNTTTTVETDQAPEVNDSIEQVSVAIVRETMTLLPQEVMWFRLINLDTKKRKQFKRKDRYEIDLRKHDWLFATEDAHFAIIDNDRFEEYSGEGKLFFRLDQEGIHQLSEDEYRAVEK